MHRPFWVHVGKFTEPEKLTPATVEWVIGPGRSVEITFDIDTVKVIEWETGARMITHATLAYPAIWHRVFGGTFHLAVDDDATGIRAITIGPLRIRVDESTIHVSRIVIMDVEGIGEIPRGNAVQPQTKEATINE